MTRARALLMALAMAVALVAGAVLDTPVDSRYILVTAGNVALLGLAFWVALPAIGGAACLLLFAGPTLWWIDKQTVVVPAFAAITIALSAFPPTGGPEGPPLRKWVLILALLAAVLLPAYGQHLHWPSFAELIAVPMDPAIGLAASAPILALVTAVAVAVASQLRRPTIDQVLAIATGIVLLFSVSQVTDLHGDTPGPSRYINWFIPLCIPFLRGSFARRRGVWVASTVSAVLCVSLFHPATHLYAREPAHFAGVLWTHHPGANNPLPEVFTEVIHTGENRLVPAASTGCEKMLIAGSDQGAVFPVPCFPAPAPRECSEPGALCYANRDGQRYAFVPAPGSAAQHRDFRIEPRFAWPPASVEHVRQLLTQWEWWTLHHGATGLDPVREIHGVRVIELKGERRLVFILREATDGAHIALRLPWKATGALIDAATGQTIRAIEFSDEPGARLEIDLPSAPGVMLLSFQAS